MRIVLSSVLLVAACHHAVDEHEAPIPVPVRCVPAARETVGVTETLRGRVTAPPGGDLPVASQVPGRVVEVHVHEGDRVAAGAIVATIDDNTTRGALTQANAALDQAKSAAANADATLERTRQLVARGIAAKQELDDTAARAAQAHSAISAAVAGADVARRTLGRVQVRTTFDGVVTRVWRGVGALVDGTAATPIVQLASTTLAEFDADATERQLVGVNPGQLASIVLATGGDRISGTVRARSTALDPATGLGLVRIAVDSAFPVVLGMFGTATLAVGERRDVLVVPASAMKGAVADGAELAICKDGKAEIRTINVGWRDDARVEVVAGVAEGERVAVDHVLGLETGTPIVEGK
ncbi:MAG: efflux RND transporter periplasmic adaptor subunit [Myxococcota bacterium]|nr:efflux RND transporter periplasmic adaptor subunit [Myxococcota bacterium]